MIISKDAPKLRLCHENFEGTKFFNEQRNVNAHESPNKAFFKDLKGELREPLFKKIKCGSLNLSGVLINPSMVNALANFIISSPQLEIKDLILDNNGIKDKECAKLIKSVGSHQVIRSVTYAKNEFGYESIEELRAIVERENPLDTLEAVCLSSVKTDKYVI